MGLEVLAECSPPIAITIHEIIPLEEYSVSVCVYDVVNGLVPDDD